MTSEYTSRKSGVSALQNDDDVAVLFVDDDENFGSLVGEYLEQEHHMEVTVEHRATDALDRLDADQTRIDCVVSDYEMPGMNGVAFLEAVQEEHPDLPFVMFAGQGSEEIASEAIHLGVDDYLQKDTGEARYDLLANRVTSCVTIARQQQELQDLYAAVENAGHAMLVTDTDGIITYLNPTFEEISGYDREDLLGETPSILNSGEHDQTFYTELWATILDGEVWEGEVVNERPDGERYVIDQTISPITDARGEITGFVAINRDITERKERERQLTFFEQAIEQIGTGMAAYSESGAFEYANEAYAKMLGTTAEKLEDQRVSIVNPAFDPGEFSDYWESFGDGETRVSQAIHSRLDTGEQFPVDVVTTHITVEDKDYHVGTIRDITERKQRERELRMFRQAVEHAGHAVIITETDGTIEYVNPAFEELTGYDSGEAVGETPAIVKSGEHGQEFYTDLWSTILDGEIWEGELINERKVGTRYIIDQTIAPIFDEDGDIDRFVAINNDITDLKEYERELERQNERLEQFGRTVAHDLRNPLNVMEGYLSVIREAEVSSDAAAACEQVTEATQRMRELIEELLTLAKQGQTVLNPHPVTIKDVVTSAWTHVDTKSAILELDDDIDGDAVALADESRTTELFENLYRNAIEHVGDDATVRVGCLDDGFYVEDDGPGIPPEDRDDVLESGFTTSDDGTGFGLAIVAMIAEAHNWTITITESTDGGARFEFRDVAFQ
jgi:PAS domain S-box-containing protein